MSYFRIIEDLIKNARGPPPLEGVKVVEFSHYILGPNIPRLLAQLGAEVIKIEPPPRGDRWKYASMWGGKGFYKGMRIDYLYLNSNKYFVGIDFRKEEGESWWWSWPRGPTYSWRTWSRALSTDTGSAICS